MSNQQLFNLLASIEKSRHMVIEEIRARNIAWQHLADNGLKVEAILSYRQKYECSLKEAKEAIDAFLLI